MNKCQVHCLDGMACKLNAYKIAWQHQNRIKRILKRRLNYVCNWIPEKLFQGRRALRDKEEFSLSNLQKNDVVRVKSNEEINRSLNRWGQLKGCSFMEEMYPYCNTTQRILKRVEKFLDERDYLIKKCNGIVILESVFCSGTKDFGACDRTCYFFWREEWLEKQNITYLKSR